MHLILLTGLRLLGKHMAGQLSRTELAALVSLAAAIGIPLLSPDQGVVGSLAVAVVVLGQRLFAHWTARRPGVERALQGNLVGMAAGGVLQRDCMEQAVLSQEHLFAQLRGQRLEHLG